MITLCKNILRPTITEKIKKDFPNADIVYFDDTVIDFSVIQQEIETSSLFGNDRVIVLIDINKDFLSSLIKALATLPENTHVFWKEDSFLVATLKKLPPYELWEGKEIKSVKENPFTIANKLGSNPLDLWTTYQILLEQGNDPEALFGILWWKLKDIAKKQKDISPNLKNTFHRFLSTYSSARESGGELSTGLEKLLLSLTKKDLI
jgi:DNA polymerase III delta subunit